MQLVQLERARRSAQVSPIDQHPLFPFSLVALTCVERYVSVHYGVCPPLPKRVRLPRTPLFYVCT